MQSLPSSNRCRVIADTGRRLGSHDHDHDHEAEFDFERLDDRDHTDGTDD